MPLDERERWLVHECAVRQAIQASRGPVPHPWMLREPSSSALQNYFILRAGVEHWLGRRCVLGDERDPTVDGTVRAEHLLGPRFSLLPGDGGAWIDVDLHSLDDARRFFARAASDIQSELVFPYPALDAAGRESVCPASYWAAMSCHPIDLARDELHIDHACAKVLRESLPGHALVHDPACSTGDFLARMRTMCPHLRFSGSDSSPAMIDVARDRHGDGMFFDVADAVSLPPSQYDGLIVRFLNAEVVTRDQSITLLDRLLRALRPGGIAILVGHTALLPPIDGISAANGCRVRQRSSSTPDGEAIFQCYVIARSE